MRSACKKLKCHKGSEKITESFWQRDSALLSRSPISSAACDLALLLLQSSTLPRNGPKFQTFRVSSGQWMKGRESGSKLCRVSMCGTCRPTMQMIAVAPAQVDAPAPGRGLSTDLHLWIPPGAYSGSPAQTCLSCRQCHLIANRRALYHACEAEQAHAFQGILANLQQPNICWQVRLVKASHFDDSTTQQNDHAPAAFDRGMELIAGGSKRPYRRSPSACNFVWRS